ncbi:MAG TPA: hypothetical protein VNJ71_08805 [Gemmatimonadales bacterium]|nr:hypothetical protein [Gemmatimonadales bacterium]
MDWGFWLLIVLFWAVVDGVRRANARRAKSLWPEGDPATPWWVRDFKD